MFWSCVLGVVGVEVAARHVMALDVPLHVRLVLEFGLQQRMLHDSNPNVHHHHLEVKRHRLKNNWGQFYETVPDL